MKRDAYITLTKVEETNAGVLPIGYWLKGRLIDDIKVGATVAVHRHERMGLTKAEGKAVQTLGLYQSSPVRAINGDLITTDNSVWRLTVTAPPHSP